MKVLDLCFLFQWDEPFPCTLDRSCVYFCSLKMIEETGAHRPGDSVLKMDSSSPGDAGQEQEDGGQDSVRIWSFTFHRKKAHQKIKTCVTFICSNTVLSWVPSHWWPSRPQINLALRQINVPLFISLLTMWCLKWCIKICQFWRKRLKSQVYFGQNSSFFDPNWSSFRPIYAWIITYSKCSNWCWISKFSSYFGWLITSLFFSWSSSFRVITKEYIFWIKATLTSLT